MEEVKQETEAKEEGIKLEEGDIIKIFKGERPPSMDQEVYRLISKQLKKTNKKYLKGHMIHGSNFVIQETGEGDNKKKEIMYTNKGITYYKSK